MKGSIHSAALSCLHLLALSACGDPLVDDQYRGEPIFVVQGRIESFTAPAGIRFEDYQTLAALFWVTDLNSSGAFVEQSSVSTRVSFPATFELQVFEAPRPEHFLTLADGTRLAFGALLVYIDVDGNGHYSDGDRLIGGSGRTGLLYAESEVPISNGLISVFVPAGFSVRRLDYLCGQTPPEPDPVVEYELSGRACNFDLSCPEMQRCIPVRKVCVTVSGPGVTRCSADLPCTSDRQVCHQEQRICVSRELVTDQICRTTDSCGEGQECLTYYGCALPLRPDPVPVCHSDLDCEPLGFTCDPKFAICVPKEALEINVPGTFEPALLTCSPTRG